MIRKTTFASMFVILLLASGFFVQSASAQGKTTTDHKWDSDRKTSTDTTKNGKGEVTREVVTEYGKDDSVIKRTTTEYYPNGNKRSETVIVYDNEGSHGTRQDWDPDGTPAGKGKGRQSSNMVPLRTAKMNTPYGDIVVNLPDDMRAGDTISGTVILKPGGDSDSERARNSGELSAYVVELDKGENAGRTVLSKVFMFAIPASGAALSLKLWTPAGVPAQVVDLPVTPQGVGLQEAYKFPRMGQAGRPLEVQGPFDGDMANTSLHLEAREVKVLAESPRSLIFETPTNVAGPARLELQEGTTTAASDFNNVRVNLTAPVTNLAKGQKTVVTVRVEGLQGLPPSAYPLSLDLMNLSPSVIALDNGKSTTLAQPVRYSSVDQNGCFTVDVPVRGINAGRYTVAATAHLTNAAELPVR